MSQKVLAITGGNSGIGLAISELFLEQGYKVAILARSTETLASLKNKAPNNVFTYSGDVSLLTDLEDFYNQCNQMWGGIDTVIANAGIALPENLNQVTETSFEQTMNVNVKSVFFSIQKSIKYLNKNANIILMSSIQAQKGAGLWSVYGLSLIHISEPTRPY